MTLKEQRIDEAVTQAFKYNKEMAMLAGTGAHGAFRFLADSVVSLLSSDADLECIYNTLFARVALAVADAPGQFDESRRIAAEAFRLGMECGKSVHSTLRRIERESLPPLPHELQDTSPPSLHVRPEGVFMVKDGERITVPNPAVIAQEPKPGYSQVVQ